jgi:hypothetical protein
MGEMAKNRNDRVICTKCGRPAQVETFVATLRLMRLRDVLGVMCRRQKSRSH